MEYKRSADRKLLQMVFFFCLNDCVFLFRVKSGLAPLLSKVSERKSELTKFENSIATKKGELNNYQNQIEKVASNLR